MDETQLLLSLDRASINAALSAQWEETIELNKQILKINPEHIDSLNRLARAYFEIGKYSLAKKTYQSALKVDPYNPIAQKNIKKLAAFKDGDGTNHKASSDNIIISPSLFLEEPGITKVISLVKLAEPHKLSRLSPGKLVKLNP